MNRTQATWFESLWEREYQNTHQMLAAIPGEHLDAQPDPTGWPVNLLAMHIVALERQFVGGVLSRDLKVGASQRHPEMPGTPAELLDLYDRQHAALREAFTAVDDDRLQELIPFVLPHNGQPIMTESGLNYLHVAFLHHQVHHRAQLGTYLRHLGVTPPGLYGPTRETPPRPAPAGSPGNAG